MADDTAPNSTAPNFTVEYRGDLRCELVHTASGAVVTTDAPVDNRGRGEGFSPTDLVAAGTGACMLTIMGIRAADSGWDLAGTRLHVDKHMAANPRRIGRIVVRFALPGGFDEHARTALERAALSCPVKESLAAHVELDVEFEWGAVTGS
ncbi:OsmC-like protein [Planctomycetes bacterium Pla163]|uniref:OsmC-like protein n=1 Tax=Rohdeia mirabilis TaxID=2528008 RepID=A0A518CZZ4_9BACT|nr:OsmC-like protein [Planctomycetes bacterium Pla163]